MSSLDQMEPGFLLLKRGARLLAKACGSLHSAGEIVERSHEQVRRWGDPECPETIPVHLAARLEAECGKPIITRILAELTGHGLKPMKGEPIGACLDASHLQMMMATTDLTREVLEAKRDGVITPNESGAITRAGMKAQGVIGELMAAVTTAVAAPVDSASPIKPGGDAGARPSLRSVGEG